jgi:hypothetical protein
MPYDYKEMRSQIFLEENQVDFLQCRDKVFSAIRKNGAVRIQELQIAGDAWLTMAFFDRMLELKEIEELTLKTAWGQLRVFVNGPNFPEV